jgi:nucleotide-binding universal stress UspA family protein
MKTVLAAIDFSRATKHVLAEAMVLARSIGAHLSVLHVTGPSRVLRDHAAFETLIHSADPTRQCNHRTVAAAELQGDSIQLVGDPVEVILDQARQRRADYIVMGMHGHSAVGEAIVGGTCARVLEHAPCPVVLVPAARRHWGLQRGAGIHRRARPTMRATGAGV